MADGICNGGTSSSQVAGDSADATIEINIKTLESQIFTFRVTRNMPVPLLKEQIASAVGIPVEQQRLIFRGKVLKDDQRLSEYYVEDGHTLHLVARQPVQTQTEPGTSSEETSGNNNNRGNDPTAGPPRNRIGQVSHSVVLGTINVGDQTEGAVPDISRIIGSVLNSFGITTPNGTWGAGNAPSTSASTGPTQVFQGVQTERAQNASGRNQMGNQLPPLPNFLPFQSITQPPLSQHMTIPNSLETLSVFISRLEQALSFNGSSPSVSQDSPMSDVPPSNSLGLPTLDALCTIMRRAHRLLSGHAAPALSHIEGLLERERSSTDSAMRGEIQRQSMHVGIAMQHLGSLLLELGRTILTLRMGQTPDESVVNSGPAVYISGSGPTPIMVQPTPFHPTPIFSLSPTPFASARVPGPVGMVDGPRNVNIYIHPGTEAAAGGSTIGSRANGEASRGEHSDQGRSGANGNIPPDLGSVRGLPSRTVVTTVPARSPGETASHVLSVIYPVQVRSQQSSPGLSSASQVSRSTMDNGPQPNEGSPVLQPPMVSLDEPIVSQISVGLANILAGGSHGQNPVHPSLQSTHGVHAMEGLQFVSTGSSSLSDTREGEATRLANNMSFEGPCEIKSDAISSHISETGKNGNESKQFQPDGLQISSNEDSIINEDARIVSSREENATTSSIGDSTIYAASESFSAKSTGDSSKHASGSSQKELLEGDRPVPLGLGLGGLQPKKRSKQSKSQGRGVVSCEVPPGTQNQQIIARGQQVLQTLVSNSSSDSGRNENGFSVPQPSISGQLARSMPLRGQDGVGSPAGLRTLREGQNQDLAGTVFGSGRAQGGLDLSGLFQQMMPIVSQAFSMGSSRSSPSVVESEPPRYTDRPCRDGMLDERDFQMDIQQAVKKIESRDSPGSVFRSLLEIAARLNGGQSSGDLVEFLGNDEELTREFMEMLRRSIHHLLESESRSTGKS